MGHARTNRKRGKTGVCVSCREEIRQERWDAIAAGYRAGRTPKEIAADLTLSEAHVKNVASEMRRAGVYVPRGRSGPKPVAA